MLEDYSLMFPRRWWSQWCVSCSRCFCNNVYYMQKICFGYQQTCIYRWQISHLKLIINNFHISPPQLIVDDKRVCIALKVVLWQTVCVWTLQDEECVCRSRSNEQIQRLLGLLHIDAWMMCGRIKLWILSIFVICFIYIVSI